MCYDIIDDGGGEKERAARGKRWRRSDIRCAGVAFRDVIYAFLGDSIRLALVACFYLHYPTYPPAHLPAYSCSPCRAAVSSRCVYILASRRGEASHEIGGVVEASVLLFAVSRGWEREEKGGGRKEEGLFSAACLYYTCGLMMELFSPSLFVSLSALSVCFDEDGEG